MSEADRNAFDIMMAKGDGSTLSLYTAVGTSVKGTWDQQKQKEMVGDMNNRLLSVARALAHARYLHDRRKVDTTHGALRTSIKYWEEFRVIWGLPHILYPDETSESHRVIEIILNLYFIQLSLKVRNGTTKVQGEAKGDTITGHISRLINAHRVLGVQINDMSERMNGLATGHDKKLIDIHGVRMKKKVTPANIELYKIMIGMRWEGIAEKFMVTSFLALFLCLWEGLLRPGGLLSTNKKQRFHYRWFASLGSVFLVIPPSRQKERVTIHRLLVALTSSSSSILLNKPPIKNSANGDSDMIPMITAIHGRDRGEVVPGYWLAQHVLNRLMQEKNLGQEEAWKRPLFTDEKNDWMKERKAKAVWRLAVETAITLRDNKKPSAETVKKYTLYSNKTGKKVSMDYADTISGTETRMIGAWAQMGGDAPYSRPTTSAMQRAHRATNSQSITCME